MEKIAQEKQGHFAAQDDVACKFLVNHSAGSGKTLTMCWLADRLHSLYKPGTSEKVVNMVFLLTDRKSLDKNIREDFENFSHLKDVARYAKRSGDLGRFLPDREQAENVKKYWSQRADIMENLDETLDQFRWAEEALPTKN